MTQKDKMVRITVFTSKDERKLLNDKAKEMGLSTSAFIRMTMLQELKKRNRQK